MTAFKEFRMLTAMFIGWSISWVSLIVVGCLLVEGKKEKRHLACQYLQALKDCVYWQAKYNNEVLAGGQHATRLTELGDCITQIAKEMSAPRDS